MNPRVSAQRSILLAGTIAGLASGGTLALEVREIQTPTAS